MKRIILFFINFQTNIIELEKSILDLNKSGKTEILQYKNFFPQINGYDNYSRYISVQLF